MGYGLDLFTQLGTTSNYSAIVDLHAPQITAANTKSSKARNVFNGRFLVTDVNSGDFSASRTQVRRIFRS
jgi:hypothetical protein